MYQVKRRDFVRFGVGIGAWALVACASPATPTSAPKTPAEAPKPAATAPAATVKPAGPAQSPVAKAPPSTAAPAKPASLTKVSLAIAPGLFELLYPRAAKEAGIYSEAGLDIEFTETGSDNLIRGLLSGEFLVSRVGPQATLGAIAEGGDLRIVAAPHTKLPMAFVAQEGYNSLESLYGKTVGSSGPRGLLESLIFALYKAKGLDPTRLNFVNTGSTAQAVPAMAAKKIEASMMLFTDLGALRQSGARTVQLSDLSQELPNYLRQILAVRRQSILDNDALLRRFFNAHSKAYRWAMSNKEAVVQAAVKIQGRSRAEAEENFDILLKPGMVTPEFAFTEEQMAYIQRLNIDVGSQKEALPFERVADLRYVKAVAEALGPYVPPK